jgi:hypothetical protein
MPPPHWNYEEELKEQETAGKINLTLKRLDELSAK